MEDLLPCLSPPLLFVGTSKTYTQSYKTMCDMTTFDIIEDAARTYET